MYLSAILSPPPKKKKLGLMVSHKKMKIKYQCQQTSKQKIVRCNYKQMILCFLRALHSAILFH